MALVKAVSGVSSRIGRSCVLYFLLALVAAVALAEPVRVERDSVLRAEPRADAAVLAKLAAGTGAEALVRQGAWVQVKSGDATGWLFSFDVRFGGSGQSAESSGGGAALGRVIGSRQPLNVTATLGIRGLGEEDLKQAQFDAGQMRQLDGFAASREQAEAHAAQSGLTASRIEYLGSQAAGAGEPAKQP